MTLVSSILADLPLFEARDEALRKVAENAGADFLRRAEAHAEKFMATVETASGEDITNSCLAAGIKPPNTSKAFGAVIRNLAKRNVIEKAGYCQRTKGHLTAGGVLWRAKK